MNEHFPEDAEPQTFKQYLDFLREEAEWDQSKLVQPDPEEEAHLDSMLEEVERDKESRTQDQACFLFIFLLIALAIVK